MKKLLVLLLIIATVSCKSETKENVPVAKEVKEVIELEEVLNTIELSKHDNWILKNISIDSSNMSMDGDKILQINRSKTGTPAFVMVKSTPVILGSKYRVSVLVKRTPETKLFGLRMSSIHPNRSDAIFDLEEEKIKGTNSTGDFEKESALIENIGNDWYKCSLSSEVFAEQMYIVFGPTSEKNGVPFWESGADTECSINVLVDSIVLEEISI